jgi:superfamily II DNA or RNA helicase
VRACVSGVERPTKIVDRCQPNKSGKMLTLQSLLQLFGDRGEKTLVFSLSTRMLDIIEEFVMIKGWRYVRLDGDTPQDRRQPLIDDFNSDPSITLFLLSSRAGGLGINLTSASNVVIFDMAWNPTTDQQAQDRSYRVGQKKKVQVLRLVAKGTIEELVLMRQQYKEILQNTCMGTENEKEVVEEEEEDEQDEQEQPQLKGKGRKEKRGKRALAAGYGGFAGVAGNRGLQGELFGMKKLVFVSMQFYCIIIVILFLFLFLFYFLIYLFIYLIYLFIYLLF